MPSSAEPARSIELIIFDCDGVLVDSEPIANRCFTRAINQLGLDYDFDYVCRTFVGLSMATCCKMLEQALQRSLPEDFLDRLQRETFAAFESELTAVTDVEPLIDSLMGARRVVPFCVASSGEHEKIRFTLGLTGLLPRFDGHIFSATDVARGKPAPDLFLHAAERMSVAPERCLVVEDSVPGVQAAVAAGMQVLGYAERSDVQRLREAGAEIHRTMRSIASEIWKRLDAAGS